MFNLVQNSFLDDGICKYEDGSGNSVFMKRKDKGFVAKLRFSNSAIKANPITYDPDNIPDADGENMHLEYPAGTDINAPEVTTAVQDFTVIVQRWIEMLADIVYSGVDNRIAMELFNGAPDTDIWKDKMSRLSQYEELSPAIKSVFK